MIITCPSCATRYTMDDARFQPTGRMVRCAKCAHSWMQEPPRDQPRRVTLDAGIADALARSVVAGDAGLADGPAPFSARMGAATAGRGPSDDVQTRAPGSSLRLVLSFLVGLFVLGGAGAAAYVFRVDAVRALPELASLYDAIGLKINTRGLWFEDVTYERDFQDGMHVLILKGKIKNMTGEEQPVPPVRVGLRDKDQAELYHWVFTVEESRLAPAAATAFETRLSSPPLTASDVEIRFVGPES